MISIDQILILSFHYIHFSKNRTVLQKTTYLALCVQPSTESVQILLPVQN